MEKIYFSAVRLLDEHAQYAEDELLPREEKIMASSRFVPTDVVAIYCTLHLLEEYSKCSLAGFMRRFLEKAEQNRELESLLYGLWLLGYADSGQWKNGELDLQRIKEKCIIPKKEKIDRYLNSSEKGKIPDEFREKKVFVLKRLICFVRDLLKSPHFRDDSAQIIDKKMMKSLCDQIYILELPGDVWNNNEHFQNCVRKNSGMELERTKKSNELIRQLYEDHAWGALNLPRTDYYPEQFDTTFDFVPRMCEKIGKVNCAFCPMNRPDGRIPEEFCQRSDPEKFCPFLLYACGYKIRCKDANHCPNKSEKDK